jgi:hypothetical protein
MVYSVHSMPSKRLAPFGVQNHTEPSGCEQILLTESAIKPSALVYCLHELPSKMQAPLLVVPIHTLPLLEISIVS